MADAATIEIVRATPAHGPTISRALAAAFQDDPVFEWVVPDPDIRRARIPSVFAAFVDVYVPHNETYVAGDGVGGALWAPAGSQPFMDEPREVFAQRITAALGDDAERAFEVDALLESHHPTEACFYLQFLGVIPDHQGRGVGSAMLSMVLDRCDATGTPAYLEATSVDNRRLYARHGFETVGEITLPQGPALWPMWRDPLTASA